MIELKGICKKFNVGTVNESTLFDGFSFKVNPGDFVSVVGSNGSGKTTMLNLICGTLAPDSGKVIIGGVDMTGKPDYVRYKKIGRVYQDPSFGTCADMTVFENMSLADNKGKSFGLTPGLNKKRYEEYRNMLSDLGLGLEDKMHVKVGCLSGGQRQAMSLLMSVMTPVDCLILDEHTAALDPKTSEVIMHITDKIIKERKLTALMVTHNLRFAVEYGNRIVMMHEGNIVLEKSGDEKHETKTEDLMAIFNKISVECGN